MKSYIVGIALIIFASFFLIFQSDINQCQRQMDYVDSVAEEAAATAALEIVLGDDGASQTTQTYANGFIKFNEDKANEEGLKVVKKGLKLDDAYVSSSSYFTEEMNVTIYLFNQNRTYSKYVNGTRTIASGDFDYGENLSSYCESPYKEKLAALPVDKAVIINYPCAVCIIDAGKPKFRDTFGLQDIAGDIIGVGVYEYKHFQ